MSSITEILRSPSKQSAVLREFLSAAFSKPKLPKELVIVSPYIDANAALVGKAFDYLLRFELQRRFPDRAHTRRWVAESALRYFDRKDRSVWVRGKKLLEMEDAELLEFARQQQTRNDTLNIDVKEKFAW